MLTTFLPLKVYGIIFRCSRAANSAVHGRIGPNSKFIADVMVVLLTCKNKEDLIKNEGARVLTRLFINFSDTEGQLTPQSVVESSRNSSKLLWLSSLLARMKKSN